MVSLLEQQSTMTKTKPNSHLGQTLVFSDEESVTCV